MKFCSICSGSSGNCIYVGSDNTSVLVDVGVSGIRVERGLNEIDMTTKDVDGILVTHEHSDHVKGWASSQDVTAFRFMRRQEPSKR